jgi:hypothetical protein
MGGGDIDQILNGFNIIQIDEVTNEMERFLFCIETIGVTAPAEDERRRRGEGSCSSSLGIFAIEYLALGIELNQ